MYNILNYSNLDGRRLSFAHHLQRVYMTCRNLIQRYISEVDYRLHVFRFLPARNYCIHRLRIIIHVYFLIHSIEI